jgi:type II secretory pathway component PulM
MIVLMEVIILLFIIAWFIAWHREQRRIDREQARLWDAARAAWDKAVNPLP